jgi:uncharacterized protein
LAQSGRWVLVGAATTFRGSRRAENQLQRRAGVLLPLDLCSLDSIHLATALSFDEVVAEFACYDARLAEAAERSELSVVAPT